MAFLAKLQEGLGGKVAGAKEFLAEKQASLAEHSGGAVAALNAVKEKASTIPGADKVAGLVNQSGLGKFFPGGGGNRQSPIDILTSEARFDESLGDGAFQISYANTDPFSVANGGSGWVMACKEEAESTLTAVHLPDTYRLKSVTCHWGTEPMNGSEHLVGGVGYAGEIHILHWNTKYASFAEASKQADGLAILAVFLNESHDDNANLKPILNLVPRIQYKGDSAPLNGFNLNTLLPANKGDFWTYDGSLTSAPHSESVVWTVFRATIPISSGQLDALRNLYAVKQEDAEKSGSRCAGEVRPCQPLNGRLLRASFRSGGIVPE